MASDTEYFSDTESEASPSGSTLSPVASEDGKERAWYECDLSVALALLSPAINWLTGSDHVKNMFLILLVVFYLHQIIEVPWSLYLASRPRRPIQSTSPDKHHHAAHSELRTLELVYLTLSILSPLLGAMLLRSVVASFSGPSAVSWFNLSLFILATGIRPWKHAIQRLQQRTTDLHTIIHYPPSETQKIESLIERVAQLEKELHSLSEQSTSFSSEMYDHVEDAIEMMEISTRRQEKRADVSKAFVEARLVKLEQAVEALLERMEIRADGPALYRIMAQMSTFVSLLIDHLSPFLPTWVIARCRGNLSRSPRSSPKLTRSRSSIKLETIPEVAIFQPKSSFEPSRYLFIPGIGLALSICDIATLPLRRITAYLVGQIYTSRTHASSL